MPQTRSISLFNIKQFVCAKDNNVSLKSGLTMRTAISLYLGALQKAFYWLLPTPSSFAAASAVGFPVLRTHHCRYQKLCFPHCHHQQQRYLEKRWLLKYWQQAPYSLMYLPLHLKCRHTVFLIHWGVTKQYPFGSIHYISSNRKEMICH